MSFYHKMYLRGCRNKQYLRNYERERQTSHNHKGDASRTEAGWVFTDDVWAETLVRCT